jgi:glutathione peroxidase
MSIFDVDIASLSGQPALLDKHRGKALLVVNVASQCGLTPQYAGLQRLHERFAARGLALIGVPCNQFGGQEPGSSDEIATFCETSYGVTFPLTEKVEVNGAGRHPLYRALVGTADAAGHTGDIRWNFEKFVVGPDGTVAARFDPGTDPGAPELVDVLERLLPERAQRSADR